MCRFVRIWCLEPITLTDNVEKWPKSANMVSTPVMESTTPPKDNQPSRPVSLSNFTM
ncbi:hypothetical protein Hanom_Chr07g00618871 [Helianthus anomalus]